MTIEVLPREPAQIVQVAQKLHRPDMDYPSVGIPEQVAGGNEKVGVHEAYADLVRIKSQPKSVYLMWTCSAKSRSQLMLTSDQPFLAKRVTWTYGRIAWSAGGGWPVYEIPCPPRRGPPSHRIKLIFGGQAFDPCTVPHSAVGQHMTQVYAMVSDDRYDDNSGFFELIVTAYSRE